MSLAVTCITHFMRRAFKFFWCGGKLHLGACVAMLDFDELFADGAAARAKLLHSSSASQEPQCCVITNAYSLTT